MKVYVFDTCALLNHYQFPKQTPQIGHIFEKIRDGEAIAYIPQFCVSETIYVLFKLEKQGKISSLQRKNYIETLIEHIRQRKLLYCYDLHRYHNFNLEEILMSLGKDMEFMGTIDYLILAVAKELSRLYIGYKVTIVSSDGPLTNLVKNKFPEFKTISVKL